MRNCSRTWIVATTLLLALGLARGARAELGTIDAAPAATVLLPYFEVDLNNTNGVTTLFSVNNASATAVVAHVTLWTDQAVPTFNFDIYLTGYDIQTINLRDIFNGVLPVTADAGADPGDTRSNKGDISQDINFPGSTGPCGSTSTLYDVPDPTLPAKINHLRQSHTGQRSSIYGGCLGANYGDSLARGYVTVDVVNSCNLSFPTDPGYFPTLATSQNVLWGDYFYVNSAQNFAQGDSLVHIEACGGSGYIGYIGSGAGLCPFAPGDYTFYGRYVGASAADQREPLPTTFMSRYLNGGTFTGGTDVLVWRDTKLVPSGANGVHNCASNPSWFPLAHSDVVSFDEQENPANVCFLSDNIGPAVGGEQPCFPLATQRLHTDGGNTFAPFFTTTAAFGMLYMNLNMTVAGDPFPGVAQAWSTTVMDANGRFSVGFASMPLDNALTAVPGGVILPVP